MNRFGFTLALIPTFSPGGEGELFHIVAPLSSIVFNHRVFQFSPAHRKPETEFFFERSRMVHPLLGERAGVRASVNKLTITIS